MSNEPMGGGQAPKRSGMAVTALILGIVSLVPCLGVPLAIAAIILAIIAMVKMGRPPYFLTGKGFAITGLILGIFGLIVMPILALVAAPVLGLSTAILLPSLAKARELANRSACAANLREISNSMVIYAVQNSDQYPVVPYAVYSASNAGTSATTGGTTADAAISSMYRTGSPLNGSPLAGQWLLVLSGMSPKLFICKSDVQATGPASMLNGSDYYTNFQSDNQLSYSFAYPYGMGTVNGKPVMGVGEWWRNTTDASLPLMADMAPLNGTGNPPRNVCPSSAPMSNKLWNSGNHQGDGQNVAYADVHVDYVKRPDVGQSNDNIYSFGGSAGPTATGGTQPVKVPIAIPSAGAPYDIYMVPARNLDTGGL